MIFALPHLKKYVHHKNHEIKISDYMCLGTVVVFIHHRQVTRMVFTISKKIKKK